jgi:hypothetical protein
MEGKEKRRDAEKERYCLPACPEATARVGPRPGAAIQVFLCTQPCDMSRLWRDLTGYP